MAGPGYGGRGDVRWPISVTTIGGGLGFAKGSASPEEWKVWSRTGPFHVAPRGRTGVVALVAVIAAACSAVTSPPPTARVSASAAASAAPASPIVSAMPSPSVVPTPTPGFSAAPLLDGQTVKELALLSGYTATLLQDGRVLIAGGDLNVKTAVASAWLYDPNTGALSPTGSMATARQRQTATLLHDGRVLIAGGSYPVPIGDNMTSDHILASAEVYDPKTGTFNSTSSMTTARENQTATLLTDGSVLIAGGDRGCPSTTCYYNASAELFDPNTGAFSATGPMTTPRVLHTATLLSDGRVLITGGAGGSDYLATAELFDPATRTFSPTGSMGAARADFTATLLQDGHVLVAGGRSDNQCHALSSAELYNPKTGTFSPTGPMGSQRCRHSATLLRDGRVLIAGGDDYLSTLQSAELYDPMAGDFSPTGSMAGERSQHTALLLADGSVLVFGEGWPLAELYTP